MSTEIDLCKKYTVISDAAAPRLPLYSLLVFPRHIQGDDSANFKSTILHKFYLLSIFLDH